MISADMTPGDRLPLSALLSQALVAFTIEFDNEAELQIPHKTTRYGGTRGGVWLVSMVMWLNCMRYVGTEPVRVGEVARLARCATNLDGMRRWGYLRLEPDPGDSRANPPARDLLARATARGMRAREVWEPLTGVIEQRWRDRFGGPEIDELTASLRQLGSQLGDSLPDCLPILGFGLLSSGKSVAPDQHAAGRAAPPAGTGVTALAVPWLLARVLLALAIEFERETGLSLAISADLLRVLGPDGVRVRDLPLLTGVSAEGLTMASGFTGSRGLTTLGPDPAGRAGKVISLTPAGAAASRAYGEVTSSIEDSWQQRFGAPAVTSLRAVLERLAGQGGPGSPLFAGLQPGPEGWRSRVRAPQTLPHFPMVLHRGGFPDGS